MKNYDTSGNVIDLLTLTKGGQESAFVEITKQYKPLIDSTICYFSGQAERDELEQEALIGLYRAACSYDPHISSVSFGLYAKICITNSLLTFVRNEHKRGVVIFDGLEIGSEFIEEKDPSDDYISKESFIKLDKFVRSHLSDYEYAVYTLYIEGYRVKEIANRLSKTEKSVEGAIMRLKIKMRNCIINYDL